MGCTILTHTIGYYVKQHPTENQPLDCKTFIWKYKRVLREKTFLLFSLKNHWEFYRPIVQIWRPMDFLFKSRGVTLLIFLNTSVWFDRKKHPQGPIKLYISLFWYIVIESFYYYVLILKLSVETVFLSISWMNHKILIIFLRIIRAFWNIE